MKIGFIGLGQMGKGMALNVGKSDATLVAHDIRDCMFPEFTERGLYTTLDVSETWDCDINFLCLPGTADVEEVVLKEGGLADKMKPGSILVDCSTIAIPPTYKIYEVLKAKGIGFIDAPISGREVRANDGTLTIMCGGREEDFLRVKPYFDLMGTTVLHMGEWGCGQLTKMVNNCAMDICTASFCELMPVGVKMGLNPEKLGQVLTTASGSSDASKKLIPEILKGNFDFGFSLSRAYKDMAGMAELCTKYQIPLPTLNGTMQTYQLALQRGDGDLYKGAMIRFYEEMLGVECRSEDFVRQAKEGEGG